MLNSKIKEELKNPKNLISIGIGIFLGATILAMFANSQMQSNGRFNNSLQYKNTQDPKSNTTTINGQQVSETYKKALENPSLPFTDEKGIVHPPIGGTGQVQSIVDPSKIVHPPVSGSNKPVLKASSTTAKP